MSHYLIWQCLAILLLITNSYGNNTSLSASVQDNTTIPNSSQDNNTIIPSSSQNISHSSAQPIIFFPPIIVDTPSPSPSPKIIATILSGPIREPITSTTEFLLHSVTLVLTHFSGAFITAPYIRISGTLTVDFSNYDPTFTGSIQTFSSAPEGTFSNIYLTGLNDCRAAELGTAGEIYVTNTCTTTTTIINNGFTFRLF